MSATPKREKEEPLKNFKKELDQEQEDALTDKVRQHDHKGRVEIRRFKRQQLLDLHKLEQKLLKEVSQT